MLIYNIIKDVYITLLHSNETSQLDMLKDTVLSFHSYNSLLLPSKGKSVPLLAESSREGSRKLRFPDFMTTAQDDVKVVSPTHRPLLPPGNTPGTRFC